MDTSALNSPGPVLHVLCGWCVHSAQFTRGHHACLEARLCCDHASLPTHRHPLWVMGTRTTCNSNSPLGQAGPSRGGGHRLPLKASCVTTREAHPATDAAACPPTRHCWWEMRWGRTPASPQDQPVLGRRRAAPGSCAHEFSRPLNITAGALFPGGQGEQAGDTTAGSFLHCTWHDMLLRPPLSSRFGSAVDHVQFSFFFFCLIHAGCSKVFSR